MLIVHYNGYSKNFVFPDNEARAEVNNFVKKNIDKIRSDETIMVETGSELTFIHFRILVAHGYIPYTNIMFEYNGKRIGVNKRADLDEWPEGMCDEVQRSLLELLTCARAAKG